MKFALVNGIKIFAPLSRLELLNSIRNYKGLLIAVNAEKIIKSNDRLKNLINQNIGYPDGIGSVLALKQKGLKSLKIAGAEFWLDIIKTFYFSKSFYLIGGSDEVINKTVEKISINFPGIDIKNYSNGFLSDRDEEKLLRDIQLQKPDIIFTAMGTPKQENLMEKMYSAHPALYMGLGGSFDVFTGKKRRAPKLFIWLGLEWFYRLLKEPTRYKRQVVYIKFLYLLIFNKLK
jgi:UDP-N-acetyl-D-mannosaminouronate:lipid I N-acetyl-D-mannosaminouronosyltransferase